jgi:hypothetical protein
MASDLCRVAIAEKLRNPVSFCQIEPLETLLDDLRCRELSRSFTKLNYMPVEGLLFILKINPGLDNLRGAHRYIDFRRFL